MKRIAVPLLLVLLLLSGCGGPSSGQSSGAVKVAGSSSVSPLMRELKNVYETSGGPAVEVQESGSTAGISATQAGAADIGMSSRDLTGSEEASGLKDTVIALDGIAVIVHPDNPVGDLTLAQLAAVYKGEIANWKELGGNDGEIIVISREEGSGTRGAFEELTGLEGDVERDGKRYKESLISRWALYENSTGGVKSGVAGSRNAIGYISLGTLDSGVRAMPIDGTHCTEENIRDGSYPIARPFLICTMGEPGEAPAHFIRFVLSKEGQAIVSAKGYVPAI